MSLRLAQIVKDYSDRYIRFRPEEQYDRTIPLVSLLQTTVDSSGANPTQAEFRALVGLVNSPMFSSLRGAGAAAPAASSDGLGVTFGLTANDHASGIEPFNYGAATTAVYGELARIQLQPQFRPRVETLFRIVAFPAIGTGGFVCPAALKLNRSTGGFGAGDNFGWLTNDADTVAAIVDRRASTNSAKWCLYVRVGGTATTLYASNEPDVVISQNYKVGIVVGPDRRPTLYVNDRPLLVGPALTAAANLQPYAMIANPGAGGGAASMTSYYMRVCRRFTT